MPKRECVVRQKSTCTIYSFSSYAAYLRWQNARYEERKVFDVSETWRDKKQK